MRELITLIESEGWHGEQHSEAGRAETMKLLIVVERTETGYAAHSPDLPGCIAAGPNRDIVEQEMRDAIAFHLEEMRTAGDPLPVPSSYATYIEVAA